jgi:hypothetical protein
MPYWLVVLLEYSIIISIGFSLQKLRHVEKEFIPFIISLWVNFLACIATDFAIYMWEGNAVVSNIYFILFCVLIVWQFKQWGLFSHRPRAFYVVVAMFVLIWSVDNLLLGNLNSFNPYARILNSIVIVLLAIHLLSSELVPTSESFWKSPRQLILVAYILLFTVKLITEVFWQYGMQIGDLFLVYIYILYQIVNFFANLLYSLAVLWIPDTTRYSWPSR